MFDDSPVNNSSNQTVANSDPPATSAPVTNPPAVPASPSTAPGSDKLSEPTSVNTDQVSNPGPIAKRGLQDRSVATLANAVQRPAATEPHPAVKRASVLHDVAEALAGGP